MMHAAQRYQQVRAATSKPSQILLALYDGLFRHLSSGRAFFANGQALPGRTHTTKAHAIVSELFIALDHDVAPDLCARLAGIYGFCLDELMAAVKDAHPEHLDAVIRVLTPLREAWHSAVRQGSLPPGATG